MRKQFRYSLALITLLFTSGRTLATCTATERNSNYGEMGSGTTATVSATIDAKGDLVAIAAWCYTSCTPVSVTLGNQVATKSSVSGLPGLGVSPDTGQGFIFYVLSAAAAGTQTITWTVTGVNSDQTQVAYIDFAPSAGCAFTHHLDSAVGSGTGGTANTPSITGATGDLLFNFTWVTEHVTDVNSPWSCTVYNGSGQTGDCSFDKTRNADAYILAAPSGSTANNMTMIHGTDSWQGLITSFSITSTNPKPNPPTGLTAFVQ